MPATWSCARSSRTCWRRGTAVPAEALVSEDFAQAIADDASIASSYDLMDILCGRHDPDDYEIPGLTNRESILVRSAVRKLNALREEEASGVEFRRATGVRVKGQLAGDRAGHSGNGAQTPLITPEEREACRKYVR